MDSDRLIFGSSSSHRPAHMPFSGGSSNPIFQETRSMLGVKRSLPFFTSAEELLLEDRYCYYDDDEELVSGKKRRLTPEQVRMLEGSFEAENKPEPDRKDELARKLGLKPKQVAVWFQNRRARWKTKQLELNLNRLKAAYDSLVADHNSILKDNDRLRSQVAILTEVLQAKELTTAPAIHTDADQANAVGHRSAVVDGGEPFLQESFVPAVGTADGAGGVLSEENGGSDDGGNCIPACGMLGENFYADYWWGITTTWN